MPSIWDRPTLRNWQDQGCGDEEAERLAHAVIGAAIEVHRELGPGLLESAYEDALVGEGRIDLPFGGRLVVELKVCDQLNPLHHAQVRAYLCVTGLRLGPLINFNVTVLHDGIRRVLNVPRGSTS